MLAFPSIPPLIIWDTEMPAHLVQIFDRSQHIIVHIVIHLSLPRWTVLTVASWILHTEIQHHRANVLKRPPAECARDIAVVRLMTAAFLPVVFGVFAHGALSLIVFTLHHAMTLTPSLSESLPVLK